MTRKKHSSSVILSIKSRKPPRRHIDFSFDDITNVYIYICMCVCQWNEWICFFYRLHCRYCFFYFNRISLIFLVFIVTLSTTNSHSNRTTPSNANWNPISMRWHTHTLVFAKSSSSWPLDNIYTFISMQYSIRRIKKQHTHAHTHIYA